MAPEISVKGVAGIFLAIALLAAILLLAGPYATQFVFNIGLGLVAVLVILAFFVVIAWIVYIHD